MGDASLTTPRTSQGRELTDDIGRSRFSAYSHDAPLGASRVSRHGFVMRSPARQSESADERRVFLSTLPAERDDRRLALAVVFVSVSLFVAAVPFAKMPLGQVWAFIPIYQSALVINDVITAGLLLRHVRIFPAPGAPALGDRLPFTALISGFSQPRLPRP